jgi:hypothetical protein
MRTLLITRHAEEQMWVRGLTVTQAEAVLNGPELEWRSRKETIVMIGTVGACRVKIVVKHLGNEQYKLITIASPDEP